MKQGRLSLPVLSGGRDVGQCVKYQLGGGTPETAAAWDEPPVLGVGDTPWDHPAVFSVYWGCVPLGVWAPGSRVGNGAAQPKRSKEHAGQAGGGRETVTS